MRRREFITLLGGGAAAMWPLAAGAQQRERMRLIGVLLPATADNAEFQARMGAFLQGLALLGWNIGRNVRIDIRWATPNATEIRRHAAELVALAPDVMLAHGDSAVTPLLQATRTVPVVFPVVADPVAAGFVDSLARPGGNATGFMIFEYSLGGKWLELLKEIAPTVTRAAVLRDPAVPSGTGQFGAIQAVAPSLRVEVNPVNMRDAGEIERAVATFARSPNGGLILTGSNSATVHRDLIIKLAARHKLPAVYYDRLFVAAGGLISYGPDMVDQYRRAAGYVDRILKGEKPADLPVQAPTKYELVINLKAAPRIKRMLVLVDLQVQASSQLQSIESASSSLALELTSVPIRDPAEIDPTFSAFAREANGGVIIMPGPVGARHRERFVAALAAHRLPAIYPYRYWIESGGLMSYGVDTIDPWRRAANYVDRILRGQKPADLPVQAPTKFELVINLKTAKALGLDMPPTLLARADEVIE